MSDLIERLSYAAGKLSAGGGFWQENDIHLLHEAADEIERLQSICGAVSPGQSVADIKQHLRTLKQDKADGSRESSAG